MRVTIHPSMDEMWSMVTDPGFRNFVKLHKRSSPSRRTVLPKPHGQRPSAARMKRGIAMIRRRLSRLSVLAFVSLSVTACAQTPTTPPQAHQPVRLAGETRGAQGFRSAATAEDLGRTVGNVAASVTEKAGELAQRAEGAAEKAGGVVKGASEVAGGVVRSAGTALERFGTGVADALSSRGGRLGAVVGGALLAPFGLLPALLGASQGALLGRAQEEQPVSQSAPPAAQAPAVAVPDQTGVPAQTTETTSPSSTEDAASEEPASDAEVNQP